MKARLLRSLLQTSGAAVIAVAATVCICRVAFAEEFPTRPVRLLVPFSPGGGSDTAARVVAPSLGKHLGVSVYVENRDGGGGLLGMEAYVRAEQDGYSILVAGIAPSVILPAGKSVSYNVERDFVPLGQIASSAQALAIRTDLGTKTVAEFVARAKAAPGKMTIGSAGAGTLTHVAAALLEQKTGITLTSVPFRGGGALLPALVGGHIDSAFADATTFAAQSQAGKLKMLATTGPIRSAAAPDIPTMAEAGFPEVEAESWTILLVNSKVPPAIIARLQEAVLAVQQDPEFLANLKKQGMTLGRPGVDAARAFLKSESEKWTAVVKAAGLRFD